MRCRICRKLVGGSSAYGMPRASAEYRCVCAQTFPGTTTQPLQSRRGSPEPAAVATRPSSVTATSPLEIRSGSSDVTTVAPVRTTVIRDG